KVVGAFHGLSRARSDARKYPAIDPIQSWSKYSGVISADKVNYCFNIMRKGVDVGSMMKVVGEEGTSLADYLIYLKEEMLDAVYFQQNSFDAIDANATVERQKYDLDKLLGILGSDFALSEKDEARTYFNQLRQKFIDWNYTEFQSDNFKKIEKEIDELYASKNGKLSAEVEGILKA
ncbi:MAG: V-type ATP synthase subunit A, partial [Treponema sp.]|nr:V-type ATP synthase subunit A [Treponema sp.]